MLTSQFGVCYIDQTTSGGQLRNRKERFWPRGREFRRAQLKALGVWFVLFVCFCLSWGCGIKHTLRVPVSRKVLEAKNATLEELLSILERYYQNVNSLSSPSVKITYTTGKVESGKLQEYRSAPGYLVLKRPDGIRLNIQNPVTKGTIAELCSSGDDFSLWYPRDNKFFVGKNSIKEFEVEGGENTPVFTARPIHIFEAILPQVVSLARPQTRVALEEENDPNARYYVLAIYDQMTEVRLRPIRKLWFERSQLAVVKQYVFFEDGGVASVVSYSNLMPVAGFFLPHSIRIDRPADGYSLNLEFKTWRVNPEIPADAFVLLQPASAKLVQLKEKSR